MLNEEDTKKIKHAISHIGAELENVCLHHHYDNNNSKNNNNNDNTNNVHKISESISPCNSLTIKNLKRLHNEYETESDALANSDVASDDHDRQASF